MTIAQCLFCDMIIQEYLKGVPRYKYSAVQINVVIGCVSVILLNATTYSPLQLARDDRRSKRLPHQQPQRPGRSSVAAKDFRQRWRVANQEGA